MCIFYCVSQLLPGLCLFEKKFDLKLNVLWLQIFLYQSLARDTSFAGSDLWWPDSQQKPSLNWRLNADLFSLGVCMWIHSYFWRIGSWWQTYLLCSHWYSATTFALIPVVNTSVNNICSSNIFNMQLFPWRLTFFGCARRHIKTAHYETCLAPKIGRGRKTFMLECSFFMMLRYQFCFVDFYCDLVLSKISGKLFPGFYCHSPPLPREQLSYYFQMWLRL